MDAERVYLHLPVPLQNLACSVVGWRTQRTRYAGSFDRLLREAEARTYWAREHIEAFRDARLREALHRASEIAFYRRSWSALGCDPRDIRSLDDLGGLPILTKEEVQEAGSSLISRLEQPHTRTAHTSGTTGGALRFPVPRRADQEQWATWWRFRGWHGIRPGIWSALFAGRSVVPIEQAAPPYWRTNRPGRQILFSGYHMSPDTMQGYVDQLRRRRPPWLHGYPSLLSLLAAYLSDTGADLGYQVKWVTTGAENLMPHQAATIERALGVAPLEHYGMAEGVANASQCELRRLHVDEDFAAVELLPSDDGGACRIVGTGFANLAFPLIRYDTRDLASVVPGDECSCGRPGRLLDRVDGRQEDYVVLPSGARVGRLDHVFKDMVNVREAQLRQKRPGEITIAVVPRPSYGDDDERMLLDEMRKRTGQTMKIEIVHVEDLPRSKTGKLRFVVSDLEASKV